MSVAVLVFSGVLSGIAATGIAKRIRRGSGLSARAWRLSPRRRLDTTAGKTGSGEFSLKQVDRHLLFSLIALPLLKLPYPPARAIALVLVLYASFLYYERTGVLFKQGRTATAVMDFIFLSGVLLTGQFFAFALTCSLYLISLRLLIKTEDRSSRNLVGFLAQQPRCARVLRDGVEVETALESITAGDLVLVRAGEVVPVDGVVVTGSGSMDQRGLTGESEPLQRRPNDPVLALTTLVDGRLLIAVEHAGAETVAATMARILTDTSGFKDQLQSRGEHMVDRGSTLSLGLGLLALPLGTESALAALNAGFGYQMRTAAPISVLNFLHLASRDGFLVKDGRSLEQLGEIDTLVLDMARLLDAGRTRVARIHYLPDHSEAAVLWYAAVAEFGQTPAVARAIQGLARARGLALPTFEQARYLVDDGIQVTLPEAGRGRSTTLHVGNARFMDKHRIDLPGPLSHLRPGGAETDPSLLHIAVDGHLIGVIELHASIRPEARALARDLRSRGLTLCLLCDEPDQPTRGLAEALDMEENRVQVLSGDKAAVIARLQAEGRKPCLVGDGIKDATAMRQAHTSISLSGAATVAVDAAAIVLLDGNLAKLPGLLALSRAFANNLSHGFRITVASGALCIGGIFLAGWGLIASVLLYNAGLVASVSNSMLPLVYWSSTGPRSRRKPLAPDRRTRPEGAVDQTEAGPSAAFADDDNRRPSRPRA